VAIPTQVSGRRLLIAVIAWPVTATAAGLGTVLVLRVVARAWARAHSGDVMAIVLAEAYLLLLVTLLACFGGPRGLRDGLGFRYTGLRHLALAWASWLFALAAGIAVLVILEPLVGRPRSNAEGLVRIATDPLAVAVLVPTVTLLAPLTEELLFRGALFGWLRRRLPWWAAAIISAAVFAGAHLIPSLFPTFFVFGLVAAAVYQYTRSTLNTFVMHASQNTLALILVYTLIASGAKV
jgi:membrane protease YdiL (CAAX protease family)